MRIAENGVARCSNCGSDHFTSPQLTKDAAGETDVHLCCSNCSTPVFMLHEADPEAVEVLAAFFNTPESL